jgi:hypothetical protein
MHLDPRPSVVTSGIAGNETETGPAPGAYATFGPEALQVFALCGLAIAQPLFDLLGRNSTFLVVHDVGGFELVVFAFALILVPPLVILAALSLVRLVSARAAWWMFCGIAGLLVALFVVPAADRALGLADWVWFGGMVIVAVGTASVFARFRMVRGFATYLSPAPILFLALFLFVSPANALLSDTDPAAVVGASTATTPVVMVVLDEFPLGAIIDGDGRLDTGRFPGFARLAGMSTWYPNALTVSTQTHLAVPAILTGLVPRDRAAAPIAAVYPRNLFTMLGRTGPVNAIEDVTHLCPDSVCDDQPSSSRGDLLSDTAVVLGHNILPDGLETDWLPSLDGQWSDFGNDPETVAPSSASAPSAAAYLSALERRRIETGGRADPVLLFKEFIGSIHGPARPALWYGHFHFPHRTYKRLPDGTAYIDPPALPVRDQWPLTTQLAGLQVTRLMLQTAYADRLLNDLLDRLEREEMLDRALLVVMADHGQSFQVPTDVRGLKDMNATSRDEVVPVPLFVKYPDRPRARVDRRFTETIDVLPTIADALDADLPSDWKLDGVSLLAPPPSRARTSSFVDEADPDLLRDVRAARMGRWIREQMVIQTSDQRDLYRLAPYGALVGRPVTELRPGPRIAGTKVHINAPAAYRDVQPASGRLPALMRARMSGVDGDHVAVALNGTIAGVGPIYADGDAAEAAAVLDPSYFRPGANTLALYRVSGDPAAPALQLIVSRR